MIRLSKKNLVLGTGENFLDCEMREKLREEHMHIIGAPRSGKSRFMLSLILQDLKRKNGFCVIDPHGELVDHVKDWLAKNEQTTARRNVHILDYRDLEYSFGFNPLHVTDDIFIDATVERAVDAIATASTGDGAGGQHLVVETLTDVLTALAYARLTLVEARYLLSPQYPQEREAIVSTIKNVEVRENWERHSFMATKSPKQYLEKFDPAARRINRMKGIDLLRPIIGQSEQVIDLKAIMDEGDIVLLDLSLEGGHPPPEGANLLGRLFVSSFVGAAFQRAARTARPFNLYIDEVHKYLTYNIATILDECPKFGLHLTFAHQHLAQLAKADETGSLLAGVMASAQNKICFRLGNPADAEVMQRRIFAGHYDFERPKHTMDKPVVSGYETITLKGESESQGTTRSDTETAMTGEAQANTNMQSEGESLGEADIAVESGGIMIGMIDGEELSRTNHTTSLSQGSTKSRSENASRGTASTTAYSKVQGHSQARGDSSSVSQSSTESLRPILEERPTTLYSLEELQHIYTDGILNLPKRIAFAIISGEGMTKITTLDTPDIVVAPNRRKRVLDDLKKRSPVHKPTTDATHEIEERFKRFIAINTVADLLDDPMNPTKNYRLEKDT